MMMAFYMFCGCVVLQNLPELPAAQAPQHEDPQRLYWAHPLDALKSDRLAGAGRLLVLARLVVLVMVTQYMVSASTSGLPKEGETNP